MHIRILGAAGGEVTGSAYLLQNDRGSVLVDFGMFQGHDADDRNRLPDGLDPRSLTAVVLTHAHLDHTGRVPLLLKAGYRGPIYTTEASAQLADIILRDAAKLQVQDAERTNRRRQRAGEEPVDPLYAPVDVEPFFGLVRPVTLHEPTTVAPGVQVRFFESGHILGSASIEMIVEEGGHREVIVFSGDIGPSQLPILRDPERLTRGDLVFLESTYGDRNHRPYSATVAEFEEIVRKVVAVKGKILVPTFAIGRAQQILYHLAVMFQEGTVRPFPVFLDSPMAVEATRVYARHPELFDAEMTALGKAGVDPLHASHFRATVTADESKKLNELEGPCLILAGAGMCTAGRILHHFKQNLWKRDTHVVIVGFQGRGTLGRRLVEGEPVVQIHGERIAVRARVHTLGGFSAHGGQSDLLQWLSELAPRQPRVVLTHGEDGPRQALAARIRERHGLEAHLARHGESLPLGPAGQKNA